jgi:DNA-directed RNA polymerase specialized sigma24 family protein
MSKAMVEVADEVLVRRARAGDSGAVVTFATRWWPRIGRFAWGMLGNASQARAITEEVVGAVLESPQPPDVPVGRFMYRLALWLAIVRRRSNAGAISPESPVLQALDRLERMDRAAFLLQDVEELSLAETAATLESSETEIQAQVHRARILLTHLLGDFANSLDLDGRIRRTA